MEERTSWESSTPESWDVPSAMAENSTARWEMDLSPGTVAVPESGPLSGSITCTSSLDMGMLLNHEGAKRYGVTGIDEVDGQFAHIPLVGQYQRKHGVALADVVDLD